VKELVRRFEAWAADTKSPVTRVLCCGAIGGVLAVCDGAMQSGQGLPWGLALVLNLFMGAAAAFVAVYVLLGTDTKEILRASGVALLAGHFCAPVFEAGKEYVLAQPDWAADASAAADTDELSSGTAKLESGATDANLIRKTGQQAESLAEQVAYLRPGPVKTRALAALSRSIDAIGAKAGKDDADAFGSVANVGEIAARSGNQRLSEKAWTSISRIPVTQGSPVEVRKRDLKARFPVIR
jgi:hypothetical protein